MAEKTCSHIMLAEASIFERHDRTAKSVCDECVKMSPKGEWVHLRLCKTCGATLCCDSSPNTHMTHHNRQTNHAVSQSIEVGERWDFCYPDNLLIDSPADYSAKDTTSRSVTHHTVAHNKVSRPSTRIKSQ